MAQVARRNEGIAKVSALMSEFDITTADLVAARSSSRVVASASGEGRRQVIPKFRDPISGKTWSARGLKPKWLADAIARGKRLEDFAIRI
jgi:DNA-binding protein H-NS